MAAKKEIVRIERELCNLFGCDSYAVSRYACRGHFHGHYDYSISFSNGYRLYVGMDRKGYESKLPEVLDTFRRFFSNQSANSEKINSAAVSCGFRSASVEIVPQYDNNLIVWACVVLIDKAWNKWLYRNTNMHYALTGGVPDYDRWNVDHECNEMVKLWAENSDLFQIVEVAPIQEATESAQTAIEPQECRDTTHEPETEQESAKSEKDGIDTMSINGKEISVLDAIPGGWKICDGAATAPAGHVWICNGKSRFNGDYQHALYKLPDAQEAKPLHEEYAYKGRRVILDTAKVYGVYETMLMREDGEEIAVMDAKTEKEAVKQFELLRSKYPADKKPAAPAPLTGKYAKLRDDLKKAIEAGRAAEDANPEDGGTCNFDSPALSLPRWNAEKVKQAAKEAGTGCFIWNCYGSKEYVFTPNTRAQGNARSRNAEAVTAALRSMGYDAMDYCQMD